MIIKKLKVENLRNLESVEVVAHPHINILYGDNGAGKTSLLEALVILSRGRSFRSTQAKDLTGPASDSFRIFAETVDDTGAEHRQGIERHGNHWRARLDGADLNRLSALTRALPVVLMEPESHQIILGAPELRRRMLDWGLFHVEHEFLDTYRDFSKLLKQRNAALRSRQLDVIESIDAVMSPLGEKLGKFRESYAKRLTDTLSKQMTALSPALERVSIIYLPGWSSEKYEESLAAGLDRDIERGSTQEGPHRGDIAIKAGKTPLKLVFSRGEQKILTAALIMTQARILRACGINPILLLDDLHSELDESHAQAVLDLALSDGYQVWLSGVEPYPFEGDGSMFHVKHGQVEEVV